MNQISIFFSENGLILWRVVDLIQTDSESFISRYCWYTSIQDLLRGYKL